MHRRPPNVLAIALLLAGAGTARPAHATGMAQQPETAAPAAAEPGSTLEVSILTIGQGDAVWEKFGHNAIWIRDPATGYDVAFNYGIFDFDQPGFVGRLVRGDMLYQLGAYRGAAMVDAYIATNRTMWTQELNLSPAQKIELKQFLEWNAQPQNAEYIYDYYRDNCSTRVRDAIDRVLGGTLRQKLEAVETGTTFRWHTSRLSADGIPAYTGLLLGLGQPVDHPIDAWEESFLPVKLMEHLRTVNVAGDTGIPEPLVASEQLLFEADRTPERMTPPRRTPLYTAAGAAIGILLLLMAMAGHRSRAALLGFLTIGLIWTIGAGSFGTLIWLLWSSTGHVTSYYNENVLQAGPLSLILAPALVAIGLGRARRFASALALLVAGLATLGFLLQLLPSFFQVNGPIIGLALPVHIGLAAGVVSLRRAWDRRETQPAATA